MENQNACVNPPQPTVMDNPLADIGCSFTRVTKNGKPALLACFNLQAKLGYAETHSALLHHVEELNVRLPFLKVSVRINSEDIAPPNSAAENHLFVLQGLSQHSITAHTVSDFLNRLTHDFKVFLAYAKAHNIQITPNLETSSIKPFF